MAAAAAPLTRKRKRTEPSTGQTSINLQLVAGSYERVLHGFTASISSPESTKAGVSFEDNFLFNAHTSAIRCLALSPASSSKRFLATGSTDERINLYSLSTIAPQAPHINGSSTVLPLKPTRNKELGNLLHHSAPITSLTFPTHSKLLSTSLDNNIAITRTRDWTHLSTIRAPIPKATGRPSGDTFAPGEVPAGINDFAIHPSARLAISVGIGERCMRLWNLVTGKKAGVLVFEKDLLTKIGEGKFRGGEGRLVSWRSDGAEFVVGFERGLLVYSLECKVKAYIPLGPRQRVCQARYLPEHDTADASGMDTVLAIGTEDGKVLLYDTAQFLRSTAEQQQQQNGKESTNNTPTCKLLGRLGDSTDAQQTSNSRIKDFQILTSPTLGKLLVFTTATSNGVVAAWSVNPADIFKLQEATSIPAKKKQSTNGKSSHRAKEENLVNEEESIRQIGKLLGMLETGRRITCLEAFVMETPSDSDIDEANGEQSSTGSDEWDGLEDSDDE